MSLKNYRDELFYMGAFAFGCMVGGLLLLVSLSGLTLGSVAFYMLICALLSIFPYVILRWYFKEDSK